MKHILVAMAALVLTSSTGCCQESEQSLQLTIKANKEVYEVVEKKIDKNVAVGIAKKRFVTESFADNIDGSRMTVKFREKYNDYWIDFAWKNAGEITPGLWSEGYYVIIDANTGDIKEATAYER